MAFGHNASINVPMAVSIKTAKKGIWTRANATANPKGYILNARYMRDGDFHTRTAYNTALSAAKKWAA